MQENSQELPSESGFDALTVPESNATSLPEPYRALNQRRWNRRLGDHAGLTHFGVVMTRLVPDAQSSYRHAHSLQDEFVYVLQGDVDLETNAGVQRLYAGMCAGFPGGTDNAHRFVNRSRQDVLLLVVGDCCAGDEVCYPDVDLHAHMGTDGVYCFTRKNGVAY